MIDLQGHGGKFIFKILLGSDGDRAYVKKFEDYVDDFELLVEKFYTSDWGKQYTNLPRFLFGTFYKIINF